MNKLLIIFAIVVSFFCLLPGTVPALALNLGTSDLQNAGETAGYGEVSETSLAEKIGKVIQIASSFLAIIFTALMFYAGFYWMLARGDDAKVEKSKETIKAAIFGLIIVASAYSISYFITNVLLTPESENTEFTPPAES